VTEVDVVEAVKMQTTKVLEKKNITMPDVKLTGTYEILVKLHPQARAKRGSEALSRSRFRTYHHMRLIAGHCQVPAHRGQGLGRGGDGGAVPGRQRKQVRLRHTGFDKVGPAHARCFSFANTSASTSGLSASGACAAPPASSSVHRPA